jgi:hypothetical protein
MPSTLSSEIFGRLAGVLCPSCHAPLPDGTASEQILPQAKINFKSLSYFFSPKNTLFLDHVYHAFHHKFTTKAPQQTRLFSQKAL